MLSKKWAKQVLLNVKILRNIEEAENESIKGSEYEFQIKICQWLIEEANESMIIWLKKIAKVFKKAHLEKNGWMGIRIANELQMKLHRVKKYPWSKVASVE